MLPGGVAESKTEYLIAFLSSEGLVTVIAADVIPFPIFVVKEFLLEGVTGIPIKPVKRSVEL